MKNWEKYEKEIRESGNIGCIAVVGNSIRRCDNTICENCKFKEDECDREFIDWLYSDYIEKPKLTKRERMFCELAETGWITRDENGKLWRYSSEPSKNGCTWDAPSFAIAVWCLNLKFDFIKWEDTEPWSVEDLLKLEVEAEDA